MNRFIGIGRIVRDLELKHTNSQKNFLRFSIAIDRRFSKEGEKDVDFVDCIAWGRTAEFMEKYLSKGSKIAITGRIQVDSYQTKDGLNAKSTVVVVEDVEFVDSKKKTSEQSNEVNKDFQKVDDEGLPF